MKKVLFSLTLLLGCLSVPAQKVIGVSPASDSEGKMLDMAQASYIRTAYPENRYYRWTGGLTYEWRENGKWHHESLSQGARRDGKPSITLLSENGSLKAMFRDGGMADLATSTEKGISYGEDVSRREFGIGEGWYFSPDSSKVAFYRKDERAVTEFPLLDINSRTGSLMSIRYPMNGMASEKIGLMIYDFAGGRSVSVQVEDFSEERYLTNVSWSPDSRDIYIQVLDREQHNMHLNRYDATDGSFKGTILEEHNAAWVEPLDHISFMGQDSGVFIYRTDNRDGFRNLYLVGVADGSIKRLTRVDADVAYLGNDGSYIYYTSAEVSPVENHLFRIKLARRKTAYGPARRSIVSRYSVSEPERLTHEEGWHEISLNRDCSWYFDTYSSLNHPGSTELVRCLDGRRSLLHEAADPLAEYAKCEIEFGSIPSADGKFDNYYRLIKPSGFDPGKRYPLLVYVYGGPHSQLVTNRWTAGASAWEMLMAQNGYVVYVQDNRGTSNRGADFEKAINRSCGTAEMEDQMAGIRRLLDQPWIDSSRVGVHGWSYGGFMTISLMTNYPEVFKAGVAGGPVIDWKWYEVMYGERYMDNPETNPEGFARTSLADKADRLKGSLLICQGMSDDTCVPQHSLSFVQDCIAKSVQVEYFPYPSAQHNVRGPQREHLMQKITDFFLSKL